VWLGRATQTTTGKNSNAAVPHNIRGFFVSCENGKEGRTANEMIGVLNEVRAGASNPRTAQHPLRTWQLQVEASCARVEMQDVRRAQRTWLMGCMSSPQS
jgi:hypothetical protein